VICAAGFTDRQTSAREPVLLRRQHLDELSRRVKSAASTCVCSPGVAVAPAEHLGEVRQHLGIQGIGLRNFPVAFAKSRTAVD